MSFQRKTGADVAWKISARNTSSRRSKTVEQPSSWFATSWH